MSQDEDVGAALRQVKEAGLIPEAQVRWCVIGDGATWIWHQVNALFPSAVQILDDYHGSAHVRKVGGLLGGEDAVQEREWVEAMMARLFWGYLDRWGDGPAGGSPRRGHPAGDGSLCTGYVALQPEDLVRH